MEEFIQRNFKEKKFLILVVNYNLNLNNSETFKQIVKNKKYFKKNFSLILWDNLLKKENIDIFKDEFIDLNGEYLPSLNNQTLANIYNNIILNYREKFEYLILLDNDSKISEEYFEEILEITSKEEEIELILPKIKYKEKIYSPQKNFPEKLKKSIFYEENEFGIKDVKDVVAINSGMIISTNYLKKNNFLYDSKLNFYGTDNFFMYIFRKTSKKYYLMNYILVHEFSMANKENLDKALWRHKDILNGDYLLLKEYKVRGKIICFLKILNNGVKKAIEYRNINFILNIFNTKLIKEKKCIK